SSSCLVFSPLAGTPGNLAALRMRKDPVTGCSHHLEAARGIFTGNFESDTDNIILGKWSLFSVLPWGSSVGCILEREYTPWPDAARYSCHTYLDPPPNWNWI